jgi:hypothetical protein
MLILPALFAVTAIGIPQEQPRSRIGGYVEAPRRSEWFTSPELQARVSLAENSIPLNELATRLSLPNVREIRIAPELAHQRVFVHLRERTIADVMGRLLDALAHGRFPGGFASWERKSQNGSLAIYTLRRSLRGKANEEALLNEPRLRYEQFIREIRNYGRLSDRGRARSKPQHGFLRHLAQSGGTLQSSEVGPLGNAVASLSDTSITQLVTTGKLAISRSALTDGDIGQVESVMKEFYPDRPARDYKNSKFSLVLDPHDVNGVSGLQLVMGDPPGETFPYGITLDTVGILPDGLTDEEQEKHRDRDGDVIDLVKEDPEASLIAGRASLHETLALFARKSNLSVCAEVFHGSRKRLELTRGTPQQILTRICRTFACDWRKVGDTYVVWRKTWAFDRRADVPQPVLDRWRAQIKSAQSLPWDTLLEMVLLREPQFATVVAVLGVSGPFLSRNVGLIRIAASLSPQQRSQAFGESGIELRHLSADQVPVLRRHLGRQELSPPIRIRFRDDRSRPTPGVAIYVADRHGECSHAAAAWAFLGSPRT